ncbi:MAG: NAD(P)/FAD-dependent oxidoreductase, partial [Candidatus Eremiobacteraeota bacterium]|nr:NAD(P)/FAD-dependent oxidoreductase [Candidatus Eremiobacteraeota bacterium]
YVRTPVLQAELVNDGLIGTYAGPRDAGTAMVLAYHNAGRTHGIQGAWGFVRGGMGAIAKAAAQAAMAFGAEIVPASPVTQILTRNGRVAGVVLENGDEIEGETVISNADPVRTFAQMGADVKELCAMRERLKHWRIEGAALKVNLALGELPNFTARPGSTPQPHHQATIHVAPSIDYLQRAHDDARAGGVSESPLIECFLQTPTEPELAPPGKHLLSVFAQYFPYHRSDGPWTSEARERAADRIVEILGYYAPNLAGAVLDRQILAAPDLEAKIGLTGGHIFHGELLPDQMFAKRFGARTSLPGLYLCGSGAHPGGCVSGIPGMHAANAVREDLALRRTVPA